MFERVDISVTAGDGNLAWVSAASRMGVVHGVPRDRAGALDLSELLGKTATFRKRVEFAAADPGLALEIGKSLRDLVFDNPDIQALFHRTRGAASDTGKPLLVRVLATPRTVASLPWELVIDPEGQAETPLTLASDAHVVRLARARTYPITVQKFKPPLRMLMILSSPPISDSNKEGLVFDLYEEKRVLLAELQQLQDDGVLEVDVEDRPTLENLRRWVARRQRGYHIVHYVGHAKPEGLLLEDESGRVAPTPPSIFNSVLKGCPDLFLTFYAGCETAQSLDESPTVWPGNLSIAEQSVRDASQLVIGMQTLLPFRTERVFTTFFYQGIAGGRTVADAVQIARAAVQQDKPFGEELLDWAAPSLYVGGDKADAVVDLEASRTVPKRRPRPELLLDLVEGDREFFARHVALRQLVDYLTARDSSRVLWVTGPKGVGKTRLIARALDDVDEPITLALYVPVQRLLDVADPVEELCKFVAELLAQGDGRARVREERWASNDWWDRLIEQIVNERIAILVDQTELLDRASPSQSLLKALKQLVQRQAKARLVLIGLEPRDDYFDLEPTLSAHVILASLGWSEVYRWIRRNLPPLARFDEPLLIKYFADFGQELERWKALGDEVSKAAAVAGDDVALSLTDLAAAVRGKWRQVDRGSRIESPALDDVGGALRVAVAGPYVEGREAQFADAMTVLAQRHKVGGRITDAGDLDPAPPAATLLPLPSPFKSDSTSSEEKVQRWLQQAKEAKADIILCDYGSPVTSPSDRKRFDELAASGILVIAAGGNRGEPVWPAWYPHVLAVGALGQDQQLANYAFWAPRARKPDLFAPDSAVGTELADTVGYPDPQSNTAPIYGSSVSAMHAVAAAVLVWTSNRRLKADEVRAILVETGTPIEMPGPKKGRPARPLSAPRRLNLDAALERCRTSLVRRALSNGPLPVEQLVAGMGLPTQTAIPLIETLRLNGVIQMVAMSQRETYQLTERVV